MKWHGRRLAIAKFVRRAPRSDAVRLRRIGAHLAAALDLADQRDDPLLGVKLYACIAHIDEAIAAASSDVDVATARASARA